MDTLVHLLRDAAERYRDNPAVSRQAGLRRKVWAYRELAETAEGVAWKLRHDHGLHPGDRLVVWEQNSPELVAVMFGAMIARVVLVPIDPSSTPDFVDRVAESTQARLVVSSLPTAPPGAVLMADLVRPDEGGLLPELPVPDDIAEIVFTSGTTGSPKGVMLTHRNIVSNVAGVLAMFPDRPLSLVSLLPLSHMLEQTVGLFGPLAMGSTIHYPPTRRPSALLRAMSRAQVTTMVVVPQFLEMMFANIQQTAEVEAPRRWAAAHRIARFLPFGWRRLLFWSVHRPLGGHLAHLMCGGAPLDGDIGEAWERMGVRVIEGYGTTECAPVVAGHTYWERCRGSVGSPLPGVQVSLSPEDEILVEGPNVFAGYWNDAEATAAVIDPDLRYHTGDLGSWDEHGHLQITGRLSERIVLPSGMNVYPEDVESELVFEPAIEECVVLITPDDRGAERLGVVVIGARNATGGRAGLEQVEEAVRNASDRLAPHQRPVSVSLWPAAEFPRTNLFKIKRHEVLAGLQNEETIAATPEPAIDGGFGRLEAVVAAVAGLDGGRITGSSDLTLDVGLDSLGMLQLAVAIEDEFGVVIEDGELADLRTVAALAEVVAAGDQRPKEDDVDLRKGAVPAAIRSGLQRVALFPLHRLLTRRFETRGLGNLTDLDGPYLLIANHSSHLDTPSILRALPAPLRRRTAVAAAADYFYRTRFAGACFTLLLGTFPFSREGEVRSSFERCGGLADAGKSILIYPEGTRSTTGRMAPFRSGIGLLAQGLEIPVVPIGLEGTFDVLPKGSRWPRPGAISVTFGKPITVDPNDDPLHLVDQLQLEIERLLGSDQTAARRG